MGDSLHDLESRLERLVPRGISNHGRERLEEQIDDLADAVTQRKAGGRIKKLAGVAALAAVLAAVAVIAGLQQSRPKPTASEGADAPAGTDAGIEPIDYLRVVAESPSDGGYVQGEGNQPFRTWIYPVREEETVVDQQTGWEVTIVSEHEEKILTPVTRF